MACAYCKRSGHNSSTCDNPDYVEPTPYVPTRALRLAQLRVERDTYARQIETTAVEAARQLINVVTDARINADIAQINDVLEDGIPVDQILTPAYANTTAHIAGRHWAFCECRACMEARVAAQRMLQTAESDLCTCNVTGWYGCAHCNINRRG
jgi:hypothetical protein